MSPIHLSASERKIAALTAHCEALQATAMEFNALLNYIITYHSNLELGGFFMEREKLQVLKLRVVRSTLSSRGCLFELCDIEPPTNGNGKIVSLDT